MVRGTENRWSLARTMGTIHHCGFTAIFGVFVHTNKYQNLMKLGLLMTAILAQAGSMIYGNDRSGYTMQMDIAGKVSLLITESEEFAIKPSVLAMMSSMMS